MRGAEGAFLKGRDPLIRRKLQEQYRQTQIIFDETLRDNRKLFRRRQALKLDQLQTNNPNQFWKEINNMGPKKPKKIQVEVVLDNGDGETKNVLGKWEKDNGNIFAGNHSSYGLDDMFLNYN